MPNITSKEMNHKNEAYSAPKKCLNNIMAFSKSVEFKTLKNGNTVRFDLN